MSLRDAQQRRFGPFLRFPRRLWATLVAFYLCKNSTNNWKNLTRTRTYARSCDVSESQTVASIGWLFVSWWGCVRLDPVRACVRAVTVGTSSLSCVCFVLKRSSMRSVVTSARRRSSLVLRQTLHPPQLTRVIFAFSFFSPSFVHSSLFRPVFTSSCCVLFVLISHFL